MEGFQAESDSNSPERKATDEQITELIELVDAFPYFYVNEPAEGDRAVGTGLVRNETVTCAITQLNKYRYISYRLLNDQVLYDGPPRLKSIKSDGTVTYHPASYQEPKTLLQMGTFIGDYDEDAEQSVWLVKDEAVADLQAPEPNTDDVLEHLEHELKTDKATEYLGGLFVAAGAMKSSIELSLEQADAFNQRHPYYFQYSGGARMDVILGEYQQGFPVFYGIIPRPNEQLVLDLIDCIRHGEIRHGNGIENREEHEEAS